MKDYINIDKYLDNIEKVRIGSEEEETAKKASPLNFIIGKRRFSDPVRIDQLLEKAKNLHRSHAKTIFLYSLWGSMQPSLRSLGSKINKA